MLHCSDSRTPARCPQLAACTLGCMYALQKGDAGVCMHSYSLPAPSRALMLLAQACARALCFSCANTLPY